MIYYLKKENRLLLLFSVFLGVMFFILPGFIFCVFLTGIIFLLAVRKSADNDRKFILKILIAALSLRVLLLIFAQFYCLHAGRLDFFGDGEDNILRGYEMARFLNKEISVVPFPMDFAGWNYNTHMLTLFNTIFFKMFGYDIFALKYINILCIILTGWIIYDLTLRISGSLAARTAVCLFVFWPSFIFYPLTDLKESHFILFLAIILWGIPNMLLEGRPFRSRLVFSVVVTISILYLVHIRSSLMVPLFLPYTAILVFYYILNGVWSKNYLVKKISQGILVAAIIFMVLYFQKMALIARQAYEQIIALHVGFLNTAGGWSNDLLSDRGANFYTLGFFVKYFLKGWLYFLFEPLPWQFYSVKLAAYFPLTIAWVILIFLSIFGLILIIEQRKLAIFLPSLIFFFLYGTIIGMSVANIGTQIRFRDAVLPVVVISASCGIVKIRQMNKSAP